MFRKFEPIGPTVKATVEYIVKRGGTIVKDHRDQLVLERAGQWAVVDRFGRVSWQEKPIR
jgi:hypothetical protein